MSIDNKLLRILTMKLDIAETCHVSGWEYQKHYATLYRSNDDGFNVVYISFCIQYPILLAFISRWMEEQRTCLNCLYNTCHFSTWFEWNIYCIIFGSIPTRIDTWSCQGDRWRNIWRHDIGRGSVDFLEFCMILVRFTPPFQRYWGIFN